MLAPQEIIRKKRDQEELTPQDLQEFFSGYLNDKVADYQVSALLMAMFCRGLSAKEASELTKIMRDSGDVLSWPGEQGTLVDKHSTGGVGDKTSMILLPLCALAGVRIPMISGRGLGHTGGTLDKLESIPGINVRLDINAAREIVGALGGAFMGQTDRLAPLDRQLYSLRDVTATVENIGLITSSILSKKAAEGISGLVLDVKFGSGAFMKELSDARQLANSLKSVWEHMGLKAKCMLTDMNSPLGRTAGNSLEMIECVEVLRNAGPADTRQLSLQLAVEMVRLAFPQRSPTDIQKELEGYLADGQAFERFCSIIAAQGGDVEVLKDTSKFPNAKITEPLHATTSGYVQRINVHNLGLAVLALGGGRKKTTDPIDYAVGLSALMHVGEKVDETTPLCILHANCNDTLAAAKNTLSDCFEIGSTPCSYNIVAEVI